MQNRKRCATVDKLNASIDSINQRITTSTTAWSRTNSPSPSGANSAAIAVIAKKTRS